MRCYITLLIGCFLMAACSIDPVDRGEGNMLALRPVPAIENVQTKNHTLVVAYPTTAGKIDTSRVALERADGTLDYYARTRWVDFLPVIVQATLTESLSLSGAYALVRSDESGLGDDRMLKSHIRHFEAEYKTAASPDVHIEMDFAIVNVKSDRVLDSFTLRARQQATADTAPAIHDAFVDAFSNIQRQLIARL